MIPTASFVARFVGLHRLHPTARPPTAWLSKNWRKKRLIRLKRKAKQHQNNSLSSHLFSNFPTRKAVFSISNCCRKAEKSASWAKVECAGTQRKSSDPWRAAVLCSPGSSDEVVAQNEGRQWLSEVSQLVPWSVVSNFISLYLLYVVKTMSCLPSPSHHHCLLGGMSTIPSHGWCQWHCLNHITINGATCIP